MANHFDHRKHNKTPMAITVYYTAILLAFLSFLFKLHWSCNRNSPIRNWPVIGMVPGLLHNARRIHEYATQGLRQSGWTFNVKGPWFANMDFVITSDPMNVHHICSKNFANYPKGPEFREIFEALGNGGKFLQANRASELLEAKKWLQIGEEKKFSRAWRVLDTYLYGCISLKKEILNRRKAKKEEEEFDLLTAFMKEAEEVIQDGLNSGNCLRITDEFLRDVAFNLIGAGRDTVSSRLTWFFWLVARHPSVESRILEEIKANVGKDGEEERIWGKNELNKFVYLHAAACETLRLYPPVPINHKTAAQSDTLPSGHRVNRSERILLSYYSMARMEERWGKDCSEFKPERWISKREDEDQCIVHIPSYKFTAFHAGPRNCLGKEQSFIQIKMVAIVIIKNYHVRIVEGHPVSPSDSIVLHMKHGLKVRISKRQSKY
ncbi:alkane hydroxylase MAH1-like [Pistacia vera]|uniref:alkane hydroxylase MAH1-like n=1 Tax=Pistacia vera TaxID=55513 RepID=UPI0012636467|nr:alkane hydroxylase MAH1-like [Pistacia vera]